jgi:PKD repeat protein
MPSRRPSRAPALAVLAALLAVFLGAPGLVPYAAAASSSALVPTAYGPDQSPNSNLYLVQVGGLADVGVNSNSSIPSAPCGDQSYTLYASVNLSVSQGGHYYDIVDFGSVSNGGVGQNFLRLVGMSVRLEGFPYVMVWADAAGIDCWSTTIAHLEVVPAASISASANPTDAGVKVTLYGSVQPNQTSSPYPINSWTWSQGGSVLGNQQNLTISFSQGSQTVQLMTCIQGGACDNATYTETVNADPTASITSSVNPTDEGVPVTWTAHVSDGTPSYSYSWSISGTQICTTTACTYTFASPGAYTVDLTVTDSQGVHASASYTEDVDSTPLITASSNVSLADVKIPISFTSIASGGTGGYSYSWTLNGDQLSTSADFDHSFASPGSYTLDVKVTDSAGGTDSASVSVTINPDPAATEKSSANPIYKGNGAVFTATLTSGTGVSPYSWEWTVNGLDVGAGSGTSAQLTYTFQRAGNWSVNATVTDSDGQKGVASFVETVEPGPFQVALSVPYPNADPETSQTITAVPENGTAPFTYAWYVNRTLQGSTTGSLTYLFGGPGGYNVTCVATDYFGAEFSAEVNVTVNPLPEAQIISGPTTRDVGVAAAYVGSVTGGTGPYTYSWLAAGIQYSGADVTVSFATPGDYTVQLTVEDTFGHDATASLSVTVNSDPSLSVTTGSSPRASLPVNLTASVTGGTAPVDLLWTFPGGAQATGTQVQATFAETGPETYQVSLTDGGGFSHTYNLTLYVDLWVSVSTSTSAGVAPLLVTFSASVLGSVEYSYDWSFGNGNSSVSSSPEEAFSIGNWTTALVVRASNGAQGWANVTIEALPPPVSARFNPATGITVLTQVNFTARPAWYTKGPFNATWTMPSGTVLEGVSATGNFQSYSAVQDVLLNFSYAGGTWALELSVPMVPATPVISVTGIPSLAPVGALIVANASGSHSPDGHITTFTWNFEGFTYFGAQQYIYLNETGRLTLNLTVEDSLGASANETWVIQVGKVGTNASIVILESRVSEANQILWTVQATSPGGIQEVEALLGSQLLPMRLENETRHSANYTLSINELTYSAGTYSLRFIAWDDNGSSNSLVVTFTISSSAGGGFDLVSALGGPFNFWILVLTIIGALATVYGVTRRQTVDIDVGGAVLQGRPGKPLVLKSDKRKK